MSDERVSTTIFLKAVQFAAVKHQTQRRKDDEASPYINHPIEVAHLLAEVGGITDLDSLVAAILHDTIEDANTTPGELEEKIEHAHTLSRRAKAIKLAEKIANMQDVIDHPPSHWPLTRKIEYLDWTEKVVAGCRGTNDALERYDDKLLKKGMAALTTSR